MLESRGISSNLSQPSSDSDTRENAEQDYQSSLFKTDDSVSICLVKNNSILSPSHQLDSLACSYFFNPVRGIKVKRLYSELSFSSQIILKNLSTVDSFLFFIFFFNDFPTSHCEKCNAFTLQLPLNCFSFTSFRVANRKGN